MKKILVSFLCLYLSIGLVYGAETVIWQYSSYKSVTIKTNLLISRYPSIKKRVDNILQRIYKKLESKSIPVQKRIYIKVQKKIDVFSTKYKSNAKFLVVLQYIKELIGVRLFILDTSIEKKEQDLDTEKNKVLLEEVEKLKQLKIQKELLEKQKELEKIARAENKRQREIRAEERRQRAEEREKQRQKENDNKTPSEASNSIEEEEAPVEEEVVVEEVPEEKEETGSGIDAWSGSIIEEIVDEIIYISQIPQDTKHDEIGRFKSNFSFLSETLQIQLIGDIDFTIPGNKLLIVASEWNTLWESSSYEQIAWNLFRFSFSQVQFTQWIIVFKLNQDFQTPDATVETSIQAIQVSSDLETEKGFSYKVLSKKKFEIEENQ